MKTNVKMKKNLLIDGEKIVVKIFDTIDKAFEHGWESLYYPELTQVASIKGNNFIASLETSGEVKIFTEDGEILKNKDVEEIREIIEAGEIDQYYDRDAVALNNWWEFMHGTDDIKDGLVFEAAPNNIEELTNILIEYYKSAKK